MTLPPAAILAWEVCITLLQVLAITSTLIRLAHRWRTDRMWWDDWTAFPPLFCDVLYLVILWLRATTPSEPTSKFEVILFSTFLNVFIFRSVVWLSRVSLALAIARIFPPNHPCRRFAFGLGSLFLCAYITNTVTTALFAMPPPTISCTADPKACTKAQRAVWVGNMLGLIFDCSADVSLIATPLIMLWRIKLPMHQRRLVLALFSSSILSFLASLAFLLSWMLSPQIGLDSIFVIRMNAHLQALISLLVCNLLIVTMLFYRIFRKVILPDPNPTSSPSLTPDSEHTSESNSRTQENSNPSSTSNSDGPVALTSVYDDSLVYSVPSRSLSESNGHSSTFFSQQGPSSLLAPWSFSDGGTKTTHHINS